VKEQVFLHYAGSFGGHEVTSIDGAETAGWNTRNMVIKGKSLLLSRKNRNNSNPSATAICSLFAGNTGVVFLSDTGVSLLNGDKAGVVPFLLH
jgi:hypothetical protein